MVWDFQCQPSRHTSLRKNDYITLNLLHTYREGWKGEIDSSNVLDDEDLEESSTVTQSCELLLDY